MKNYIIALLVISLNLFVTKSQSQIRNPLKKAASLLKKGGNSLSEDEVISGLKAALEKGISKGSDLASAEDGYFKNTKIKIPFPPEVKNVETKLRQIGMSKQVDRFILSLNRGAEKAAKESKPIFVTAIKSMTVKDAWGILRGEDDAATQYLNKTTSPQLKGKFQPIIKKSLDEVNATKYYADLINAYNKIPFVKKVNPSLDEYATDKAIYGLFVLIAEEEAKIRKDPLARTSEILKKVFG